jgi:hypothetical protein
MAITPQGLKASSVDLSLLSLKLISIAFGVLKRVLIMATELSQLHLPITFFLGKKDY